MGLKGNVALVTGSTSGIGLDPGQVALRTERGRPWRRSAGTK